jgi:hypothetical protein
MMANVSINLSRPKILGRLLLAFVVLNCSSHLAFGQTVNNAGVKKPLPEIKGTQVIDQPATRTNVNETFELNIAERHYSQESFEAATAVGTKNAENNLNLQVGVALASGRIDVTLRNVHGRVRFRGTLDRILELFENRQAPSSVAPAALSPAPSPARSPE